MATQTQKERARAKAIASVIIVAAAIAVVLWAFVSRKQAQEEFEEDHTETVAIPNVVALDSKFANLDALTDGQLATLVKIVRFPDGDEYEIRFNEPFPQPDRAYKPDNLASGYHDLVTMAEDGDALAATVLYRMLFGCRTMYYTTDEQLAELRNDILTTQSYKSLNPITGDVSVDKADSEGIALGALEQSFEICRSVTDEMKEEAFQWQKTAAELGNPRQAKSYVIGVEGNTAMGRSMLRDAFMSGHYDAGTTLGAFLIGKNYPPETEEGVVLVDERDSRIEGFAYYYLAVAIGHADDSLPASTRESIHRSFNSTVDHMSPSEQEAGIDRAKEILTDHPNCCQSMRAIGS